MSQREPADLPPLHTWLPLLHEALAQQGRFRWRVHGNSMLPTLPPDCEVEIVPLRGPAPLGSLIVFASGSSLVVHRLVYRTQGFWVAQGDARWRPDPWLRPEQALGLVVAAYQGEKRCWPRRLSRLAGWLWLVRAYLLWAMRRVTGSL